MEYSYTMDPSYIKRRIWIFLAVIGLLALLLVVAAKYGGDLLVFVFAQFCPFVIIGTFEGLLITWLFSLSGLKSTLLMIAANSVVFFLQGYLLESVYNWDLNHGVRWHWLLIDWTYLAALIVGWPFVALCFGRGNKRSLRSFRATLLTQTISYLLYLVVFWYMPPLSGS